VIPVGVAAAPDRRAWTLVSAAWIAGLAAVVIWLSRTPPAALRDELKILQPWWLDACALAGVLIVLCALPRLEWMSVRRQALPIGVVMGLALCLTVFVAPRTNRIFYDEQIYQSIAQNLSDLHRAQVCNDGSVELGRLRCASGEYNKQPYAYPHILSLAYRVVGVHEWVAFAVNAAAMTLATGVVYLLALVLFHDGRGALFSALLFALIPQQIAWSATAAVEPTASLAAVTAVLAAAVYVASGSRLTLAALAVSAAYAVQFRPESLLVLPVVAAIAWPRLRIDFERPRGWWMAVLFLALVAAHVAHLFAVRNIGWGTEGARFSLAFAAANLKTNGRFFLGDERFPIVLSVLAIAGLVGGSHIRERWALAGYFALFFGVDLLFYAGSYDYGADVRYALMTFPPIAVLGGAGAASVSRFLSRRAPALPAAVLVASLLLFQFLWYAPSVRAMPEQAWAARADVRFAKEFAAKLPKDAYVLTQNPGMFQLWGVSAGQMSRAVANPKYTDFLFAQHPGGVYIHWNFWCNADEAAQPELCRRALALGSATLEGEYQARDQRFAFYRLGRNGA
jgi:4-amino-4-deoxy-L-arabinose transferase-like glycosyltransferase